MISASTMAKSGCNMEPLSSENGVSSYLSSRVALLIMESSSSGVFSSVSGTDVVGVSTPGGGFSDAGVCIVDSGRPYPVSLTSLELATINLF